jgi:hypothetical protein
MARRLTAIAVAGGLLLLAAPASVAGAPVGSPPVTQPDTVKIRALSGDSVDVAANDTDPDGDELRVCRVDDVPRQLEVQVVEGQLSVYAPTKKTGTYTLTYYACDTSYLTPGTVTVKVGKAAATLEILPTRKPGKLRIVNGYTGQTFRCEWRRDGEEKLDGWATVRPQSSVLVTVHGTDVEFACESPRSSYGFVFIGLPA